VLLCFAAFGAFWGAWGASLPAVPQCAGVSDAQLRLALLLVGLGALASMRLAGALFDRFGGALTSGRSRSSAVQQEDQLRRPLLHSGQLSVGGDPPPRGISRQGSPSPATP
jgi:hypothetical protein